MFFSSIRKINSLLKEMNTLLIKGMSSIDFVTENTYLLRKSDELKTSIF